jgi:4-carboxymuconolactone decarboxylase
MHVADAENRMAPPQVSPRFGELVILITARCQECGVEWSVHEPLACAVTSSQRCKRSSPCPFSEAAEEAICDFCRQLHRTHTADELTLRRLIVEVGKKAALEVTGLSGYYTMVAMMLNGFGISAPAGPAKQT